MLVLKKKVPRPNVDEINGVPSYMTLKPQLMMAPAQGYPQLDTKPGARAARACA